MKRDFKQAHFPWSNFKHDKIKFEHDYADLEYTN